MDQLCWHTSHPDLLVTASGDRTGRYLFLLHSNHAWEDLNNEYQDLFSFNRNFNH